MSRPASHIADIRKDYQKAALDEVTAGDDPILFFTHWFADAEAAQVDEINAMTLATADVSNIPHARIVLLKGVDDKGFVFFTNYESSKGREMEANPNVAAVFFWSELERQVRIEGKVVKLKEEENDIYFHSRPEGSKLGAWSSPQSRKVPDRSVLEDQYKKMEEKFSGATIPRPEYWGGYRIEPHAIEFWQGRPSRLHDRIFFQLIEGQWRKSRLAP